MKRDILLAPCLFAGGCLLFVDPPPSAEGDEGEAGSGSATGTSGVGPPVITSFVANQDVFSTNEQITFTVEVADPDGPSDIVRGTLTGSSASIVYGDFVPGDGDDWEHTISWTSFADVAPVSAGPIELWARFEDSDGNVGSRKLDLELCGDDDDDDRYQECYSGSCYDTETDDDHCGDCYSYCRVGYACDFGECYSGVRADASLAASRPIPTPAAAIPLSTLIDGPRPRQDARLERASVRAFDL